MSFGLRTYSSWGGIFDSISMSRSSLDSKTSRHSIHSTYSVSSSRETIWTRGCRHGWSTDLLGGKFGVLSPGWLRFMSFALTARALVRFSGILDRNQQLSSFSSRRNVKSRMHHRRLILGSATFRDCIRGLASVCHRVSKHTKAWGRQKVRHRLWKARTSERDPSSSARRSTGANIRHFSSPILKPSPASYLPINV